MVEKKDDVDKNLFEKKHDDAMKKLDNILSDNPPELEKVKDNFEFIQKIKDNPLPSDTSVMAFGFKPVNVNAILKNNIWNRSIFTVDKLCKIFLKMDLEMKKKYLKKKRPMDFNYIWLILLILGIPVVLLILFFLLPRFMGG